MIQLNKCQTRFFAGAGSLGYDGLDGGHPPLVQAYKAPFRLLRLLDHRDFVVVSKTLTWTPRKGNLTDWTFWRAGWPLSPLRWRSAVNAVALTNPGLMVWIGRYLPRAVAAGVKLVVSLQPESVTEAAKMAAALDLADCTNKLAGVQLNLCPNVAATDPTEFGRIAAAFHERCPLPLGVKFGYYQPWQTMVRELAPMLAWVELINAVPWGKTSYSAKKSPLGRYGYDGSVSGGAIASLARLALDEYKALNIGVPVASGGGVVDHPYDEAVAAIGLPPPAVRLAEEVQARFKAGADAVVFSTAFLWNPCAPNRVVAGCGRMSE